MCKQAMVIVTVATWISTSGCVGQYGEPEPSSRTAQTAATFDGLADSGDYTAQTAANILIFGDFDAGIDKLSEALINAGHTVTVQNILPSDLSPFNTVWHVGLDDLLSSSEQGRLENFLAEGGGLHLSGESFQGAFMNATIQQLINRVVVGGGYTIGQPDSVPPPFPRFDFPVNANAISEVTDDIDGLTLVDSGGMMFPPDTFGNPFPDPGNPADPRARNVIAFSPFFGTNFPVGAIWDAQDLGGNGRLSLIMDSGWFLFLTGDNLAMVEQLQGFLTGQVNQAPDDVQASLVGTPDCVRGAGRTVVELSGSAVDPEGDPLTFRWFLNGFQVASGPNPSIELPLGQHVVFLRVSDGQLETEAVSVTIEVPECSEVCEPGGNVFIFCHPGCPCDHGVGDCDIDEDCLPGLRCLHDAGFAFGYDDNEVDVCSFDCPTIGVGAWNYCTDLCPCDAGKGDCDFDSDCMPGLGCQSDVGAALGFDTEVDLCEPL